MSHLGRKERGTANKKSGNGKETGVTNRQEVANPAFDEVEAAFVVLQYT